MGTKKQLRNASEKALENANGSNSRAQLETAHLTISVRGLELRYGGYAQAWWWWWRREHFGDAPKITPEI